MKRTKLDRAVAMLLAVFMLAGSFSGFLAGALPGILSAVAAGKDRLANTEAYDSFLEDLTCLESYADVYAREHIGEDAVALVLNYIRCGVADYTDGSWTMMAGAENTEFTAYVAAQDAATGTSVASLRELEPMVIPNGQTVDFAHMFGCMDISYAAKKQSAKAANADMSGWGGDICDLIGYVQGKVTGTVEQMAAEIRTATENGHPKYFGYDDPDPDTHSFGMTDLYGDLDAYYMVENLDGNKAVSTVMKHYFTAELTDTQRASFFIYDRFSGADQRSELRAAVLDAYRNNTPIAALEASRGLVSVDNLRVACCYAFADYLFDLTGAVTDRPSNDLYSVYSHQSSTLAPGITQTLRSATTASGNVNYYIATADVTRSDVQVFANFKDNLPTSAWGSSRVQDQMQAAKDRHSDPADSELYMPNYTPVVGINADFYDMGNGRPTGALVMEGITYHEVGSENFFAILEDGTPMIGTPSEWNIYRDQVKEAVGAGNLLLLDGEMTDIASSVSSNDRDCRSCVGITADHRVVFLVIDGRQSPASVGGSLADAAQILLEAGCVIAVNLDGGGSSTYVAKQAGADEAAVINRPSDGYARSVSSSLMIVSTSRPMKEFDHAILSTGYDLMTPGTSMTVEVTGVSVSGDAAELPEGATLRVSDSSMAVLNGNTLFARKAGEVQLQLVATDGITVLGSKTVKIVDAKELTFSFTKKSVNAVYGIAVELPLQATLDGVSVAFNAEDVALTCLVDGKPVDGDRMGQIEGLTYTGDEASGIRQVIMAALPVNSTEDHATAPKLTVFLYRSGEATFDFDGKTGGDGLFAWNRVVTNSQTRDGITFYPERDGESMDLLYTFAVDMMQVPIPERVSPLMQYIAGSDRGMSAWDALLQLAERVNPRTEVTVTLTFSKGVTPDLSDLMLVNEYFELTDAAWDADTSTLTVRCNFIKQSKPIDPGTANSLCILSGLRLKVDKDAAWSADGQLPIVCEGSLGYAIYLRISAAHSMAQNPEFQEKYGIYPYEDDVYEPGAYFYETNFCSLSERIILDRAELSGWILNKGNWYYYVNGQALTGIRELPSHIEGEEGRFLYDLGADGAASGKLSGLFEQNGRLFFAENGVRFAGWKQVSQDGKNLYYYFSPADYAAVDGIQVIQGYRYTFEDHILIRGDLVRYVDGRVRYRWAGTWASQSWMTVDGNTYFFKMNACAATGFHVLNIAGKNVAYAFDENGIWLEDTTGFFENEGETYWIENGIKVLHPGLKCVDGEYYYFTMTLNGAMAKDRTIYVEPANGLMRDGWYTFDENGHMVDPKPYQGLITWLDEDGTVLLSQTYNFGTLPEYPESLADKREETRYYYRFVGWDQEIQFVYGDATYRAVFDMVGKNGLSVEDDGIYWLVDGEPKGEGVRQGTDADGNHIYYCFRDGKSVVHTLEDNDDCFWAAETDGTLPIWGYYTDENGVVLHSENFENGIIQKDGKLYYYIDGIAAHMGMFLHTDGNYYYAKKGGVLAMDEEYYCEYMDSGMPNSTRDTFPVGRYSFDTMGRLIVPKSGIYEEDGSLYYYVLGRRTYAGLIEIDGDLYYVRINGELAHGTVYWITKTNGLLPQGNYVFDADGKMIEAEGTDAGKNGLIRDEDGVLRFYRIGYCTFEGLISVDGEYYYITENGSAAANGRIWVSKTNGCLPEGWYTFGADGCMTDVPEKDTSKQGIVVEKNGYAYYENGYRIYAGLIFADGSYYYVGTDGYLVCGRRSWVALTNDLLPEGMYFFDESGKLVFQ